MLSKLSLGFRYNVQGTGCLGFRHKPHRVFDITGGDDDNIKDNVGHHGIALLVVTVDNITSIEGVGPHVASRQSKTVRDDGYEGNEPGEDNYENDTFLLEQLVMSVVVGPLTRFTASLTQLLSTGHESYGT